MSNYTHTFEIQIVNEDKVQGFLDFDSPNNGIKCDKLTNFETTCRKSQKLLSMLRDIFEVCKECGEIEKIEIVKS